MGFIRVISLWVLLSFFSLVLRTAHGTEEAGTISYGLYLSCQNVTVRFRVLGLPKPYRLEVLF